MTKEELREHCEKQVKMCEEWAKGNDREPSGKIYEEHKLILDLIKALEQDGTDMNVGAIDSDCVSRQAVLDMAKSYNTDGWDSYTPLVVDVEDIEELPPVTPTRKSGLHWIERFNNEDKWLECPYCHKDSNNAYNYCPNCGISFKAEKRGNEND